MERTPHQLAEDRVQLAAGYAQASEQLEYILARRPALWMTIRKGTASDKAADREYEATEDGINEMKLRMRMKAIEKQMSAAKTMIDVYMGEARNQI